MRLKNFAKCSYFAFFLLAFCACAKHYESVNLSHFSQKSFSVKKEQIYLLFLSKEAEIFHFVLTDALGVPKLKKDFSQGAFKSVAFLPPNSSFDELFYAILKEIEKCQNCKMSLEFQGFEVKEL